MNIRAAFAYIIKDNKILLLQEGGKRARGLWSFPGGHVNPKESFEEGAIRETFEESGYKVTLEKIVYKSVISAEEYKGSSKDNGQIEIIIFKAIIVDGKLTQDDEALDIKWYDKEEILNLDCRWSFIKDIISSI